MIVTITSTHDGHLAFTVAAPPASTGVRIRCSEGGIGTESRFHQSQILNSCSHHQHHMFSMFPIFFTRVFSLSHKNVFFSFRFPPSFFDVSPSSQSVRFLSLWTPPEFLEHCGHIATDWSSNCASLTMTSKKPKLW